MMTSKPVLDDPELAQKIVVAFKTIQESTELDRKLQSQNGSGHWTSRESNEASDAVDVTPMELRRSASRSRIASSA